MGIKRDDELLLSSGRIVNGWDFELDPAEF